MMLVVKFGTNGYHEYFETIEVELICAFLKLARIRLAFEMITSFSRNLMVERDNYIVFFLAFM